MSKHQGSRALIILFICSLICQAVFEYKLYASMYYMQDVSENRTLAAGNFQYTGVVEIAYSFFIRSYS